jgi:hypothetical protein
MAVTLAELHALLTPATPEEATVRVLGVPFVTPDPQVAAFVAQLAQSEDLVEDWSDLLAKMVVGINDLRSPQADARLLALFSHYLVTVRATAETGELLPPTMMTWLGKGPSRIPAENTTWFLLETEHVGSEAARDMINVIGGETTFMGHFFTAKADDEVLEQTGIFLAMLCHLRQKWPVYYEWMGMGNRLYQIKHLFLYGSNELALTKHKGDKKVIAEDFIDVYVLLSKTMYQTTFFLRLRDYATALKKSKGVITPDVQAIRDDLMAD